MREENERKRRHQRHKQDGRGMEKPIDKNKEEP
jgi:hypothetical protein